MNPEKRRSSAAQRVRTIYVGDGDQGTWDDLVACARGMGLPVSTVVMDAIRSHQPVQSYRLGRRDEKAVSESAA